MIWLDLKLIAREWRKILLAAFFVTIFLFFSGAANSDEQNMFVFLVILFGIFISVSAFWTAGSAVLGLIVALMPFSKQKEHSEDKNNSSGLI